MKQANGNARDCVVTFYYRRKLGILSRSEYRTKSITPKHAEIRATYGGETFRETFDPALSDASGNLLGTVYEDLPEANVSLDERKRHDENRRLANREKREREKREREIEKRGADALSRMFRF